MLIKSVKITDLVIVTLLQQLFLWKFTLREAQQITCCLTEGVVWHNCCWPTHIAPCCTYRGWCLNPAYVFGCGYNWISWRAS